MSAAEPVAAKGQKNASDEVVKSVKALSAMATKDDIDKIIKQLTALKNRVKGLEQNQKEAEKKFEEQVEKIATDSKYFSTEMHDVVAKQERTLMAETQGSIERFNDLKQQLLTSTETLKNSLHVDMNLMKQEVNNTVDESLEKLTQDWDKWKRTSIETPSCGSHTGNSTWNESTMDLTLKLTRQHALKTVIEKPQTAYI